MSSLVKCPICGMDLAPEAPAGLCTRCVFKRMLAPPEPETPAQTSEGRVAFPRPFGAYELLSEIARGGMGIVYKARQVTLNRLVALKVITAGELSSPDFVRRFRLEAEAAARLDHPHIVPIYEIGEFDGRPFFSMKLIDGETLRGRVGQADSAEGQRRVASLVATLARAVHYAHQRGIVHRDLKPNNVLLDSQGQVQLTDFGLAKLVENESVITKTMAVLGTPSYMAPEQARGDTKNLTTAADIYGLGAILYELLTGQPPFAGGTTLETIRQVLDKEPRRPTTLNPKTDRDLETICLKCLEKDPLQRYGSAEALADDLERWLRHEPIAARAASRLDRFAKWTRRHPSVAVLLAGLLISLALGFALTLWQSAARQRALVEGRRSLYSARIGLVEQAWARGHVNRARTLLDSLGPHDGQEDLRGFEWRYLSRICHDESFFTLADEQRPVEAVAGSPDGRLLALAGGKPFVTLWDIASREAIARIRTTNGNYTVAFSPDGKWIAAAGQDAVIRVFEVASRRELFELRGHSRPIGNVTFSPDGKWLASASMPDGVVKLWNLTDHTAKTLAGGLANEYATTAFSPDSSMLAWSAGDRTIRLTEIATGASLATLTPSALGGHNGLADSLAFSPDGIWLASVGKDYMVRLWDVKARREVATIPGHNALVTSVAFSPDSQSLVTGCADGTLRLWNVEAKTSLTALKGHEMWVNSVAFLPDGQTIVSGGDDGNVKFWKFARERPAMPVEMHRSSQAAVPPTQATGDVEPTEGIFLRQDASEVTFSSDGARMMVLDDRPVIQLWDGEVQKTIAAVSLPDGAAIATTLFADGQRAVSAGVDHKLRLWKLEAGGEPQVVSETESQVAELALSPDGQRLAAGTSNGKILVWDTISWQHVATNSCGGQVTALRFLPGQQALLAAIKVAEGTNLLLKLDLKSGVLEQSPEHHQGMVTSLALSPDGRLVAGSSRDGIARLWEADSLKRVGTFRGHSGYVTSAAFAPDGRTLATASNDGTVKLWSVQNRQELLTMPGAIAPWSQVTFSADGNRLVASGEDGMIRVWRADSTSDADRPRPSN